MSGRFALSTRSMIDELLVGQDLAAGVEAHGLEEPLLLERAPTP